MPFGLPMIWLQTGDQHDPSNCYVCVNKKVIVIKHKRRSHAYIYSGTPFVMLTVPHSAELPVPEYPISVESDKEDDDFLNYDAPTIIGKCINELIGKI